MTHKNKPNNRKNNNVTKESKADKADRKKVERSAKIREGVCPFDSSRLERKSAEAYFNGKRITRDYLYCPTCKRVYTPEGNIYNWGDVMENSVQKLTGYAPEDLPDLKGLSHLRIKLYQK